jgi:hypothetical protein
MITRGGRARAGARWDARGAFGDARQQRYTLVAQLAETDQPNGPEALRLAHLVRGRTTGGARPLASGALGQVWRSPHLRLCRLLPALVSLLFAPLLPLLPILLPLFLTLEPCILILLALPITPSALASERGQSRSSGRGASSGDGTVGKGCDLDYAWPTALRVATGNRARAPGYRHADRPPVAHQSPGTARRPPGGLQHLHRLSI